MTVKSSTRYLSVLEPQFGPTLLCPRRHQSQDLAGRPGLCFADFRPFDPRRYQVGPNHRSHVNATLGEGSVGLGLAGSPVTSGWQMKREMLSNRDDCTGPELTVVR